jgi:SAM-dependent methyltransferase
MTAYQLYNPTKQLNGNNLRYYNGKILIYFDTPFYTKLGEMEINKNWNKENYSEKYIKLIDDLIDKISESPRQYDNKIVELSLTNDKKWVPVKIRNDKIKPNSYRVGLNNISIIFDPVKPLDSIYFQKDLSMNEEDRIIIHKINQTYRKYIIEKHVNSFGKYSSVLDLCGGRGADEFNLYSNGVSKFFVIDSDTTALKRYYDRTFLINKKNYEKLTDYYKHGLKWGRDYINLNFLNYKIDKDYSKIQEDLNSRYEFNKNVDIVLMNYAVHYLCDDEEKLEKLSEFINSIMKDEGIFIVTYFDGDEILKRKENNISKIGPFEIEITKQEGNIASAKMPVPTIKSGNNYYKEEPLVLKDMIKKLEKNLDLYVEYNVYDKCIYYIENIQNKEKFIEYFKLIKVAVYTKKK